MNSHAIPYPCTAVGCIKAAFQLPLSQTLDVCSKLTFTTKITITFIYYISYLYLIPIPIPGGNELPFPWQHVIPENAQKRSNDLSVASLQISKLLFCPGSDHPCNKAPYHQCLKKHLLSVSYHENMTRNIFQKFWRSIYILCHKKRWKSLKGQKKTLKQKPLGRIAPPRA